MARILRKSSKPGFRVCNRCEQEFPATSEHFVKDTSRALGIGYECRQCHKDRNKGRDMRRNRWASTMTEEQKERKRQSQFKYNRSDKGRAVFLRKAYERIDECDMTTSQMLSLITKPCFYCDTVEYPRGLDRIDNSRGHTSDNVLPCCAACNFARGDRLTVDEMKKVGAVIKKIYAERKKQTKLR